MDSEKEAMFINFKCLLNSQIIPNSEQIKAHWSAGMEFKIISKRIK